MSKPLVIIKDDEYLTKMEAERLTCNKERAERQKFIDKQSDDLDKLRKKHGKLFWEPVTAYLKEKGWVTSEDPNLAIRDGVIHEISDKENEAQIPTFLRHLIKPL